MAKRLKLNPEEWLARHDTFPINTELLLDFIPIKQKMEASELVERLEKIVTVNTNNLVKYSDGSTGSHILDLVKFHLKVPGADRPRDYESFLELIGEKPKMKTAKTKKSKDEVVVLKK